MTYCQTVACTVSCKMRKLDAEGGLRVQLQCRETSRAITNENKDKQERSNNKIETREGTAQFIRICTYCERDVISTDKCFDKHEFRIKLCRNLILTICSQS